MRQDDDAMRGSLVEFRRRLSPLEQNMRLLEGSVTMFSLSIWIWSWLPFPSYELPADERCRLSSIFRSRSRARDDDNSNVMCASPEVGGGTRTR